MLDIKAIRANSKEIEARLRRRAPDIDLSEIETLDRDRLGLLQSVERLKARRNEISKEVGKRKKAGEDADSLIADTRALGEELAGGQDRLVELEKRIDEIVIALPNLPHPDVIPGGDPSQAQTIREEGDRLTKSATGENHVQIATRLGLLDLARASRLAGSHFALHRGWGARIEWSLLRFMIDLHVGESGYELILPPFVANTETLTASGQLPKFADQVYRCADDDLYLIPTAEVPLTAFHRSEILDEASLPLRYCAYTPCFRREAGAHGASERGLIRTHQFNKVEIYRFTTPESSYEQLEILVRQAEEVVRRLGLHFRTVRLVAGDLAQQAAMTYDVEVYIPGQERYYEVSSISNCEEYQARRSRIRYRPIGGGKARYVHTLNGSALATSRLLAAIIETYARADGGLDIPEVLRPHLAEASVIHPDGSTS